MIDKVGLRTSRTNPYFKLNMKKVDNSLEEAILPQHDQVALSYITKKVNEKGFAVVKGEYGDQDVELVFKNAGYETLSVSGHVGKTLIKELVTLAVSYGPVKHEVIDVNGKKVEAKTQTALSTAVSYREDMANLIKYSSDYSVKVYKYHQGGKEHVKAEGKQHLDSQIYLSRPLANEAEWTTTFNPYRKEKKTDLILKFMDNKAVLKGKLYSIRFKDDHKIAGKQHRIEVEYLYGKGNVLVKGSVYNIYKPEENIKFNYVIY